MSRLLLRPLSAGALGLTTYTSYTLLQTHRSPSRLDSLRSSLSNYPNDAQVPIVKNGGGLNPRAVRQISSGSIVGLGAGLAVSTFSRSLALIVGLLIVGLQWASSHGLDLIPTDRIQRYIKHVNLRSAIQDNVAFKVSFGTTFAMAAFMRF
ncbi:hypothetical protein MFRU_003g00970 [Monilinia fructicola]|uniref:FUN14 domain-containing protein n=1 Tax=Monilinia fructicola TaxID=38448 RepID=A0A5M9JY11_MONFR|nr:hypothetical protein EYC84_003367 [Monilinia fructicola]KAG4034122.1 hypothetical protein MFRU_003g00970 [Monilinia fructicola]